MNPSSKPYDPTAQFEKVTPKNVHPGSWVRGEKHWGKGPYIFHEKIYLVKDVRTSGGVLQIFLDGCDNQSIHNCSGQCRWPIQTFEVLIEDSPISEEEAARATSLPKAEDVLRFFHNK